MEWFWGGGCTASGNRRDRLATMAGGIETGMEKVWGGGNVGDGMKCGRTNFFW
jgi:hypothetical protein